jgi:zinc transporter 1/2/3
MNSTLSPEFPTWNATASPSTSSSSFDPLNVNLNTADPTDVICYLTASNNDGYNDVSHAARVSSIFVIFFVSTAATFFPVLATHVKSLRIPLYVYLMVRYFGAGVIIATAFIHLLDPAYGEIGPQTCVGMTGAWANYSWPPAIAMTSAMVMFLLDFIIDCHVKFKLGLKANADVRGDVEEIVTITYHHPTPNNDPSEPQHHHHHHDEVDAPDAHNDDADEPSTAKNELMVSSRSFEEQIAAFLVLEFGVIFHSVIIGLNLGVAGTEFRTLYPVLIFHQSFEGMGIGARLSVIPFPKRFRYAPWLLCLAYGLTTPISVAIGLGVRSTYSPESFTASVVSGIFDSISAGILLYTGFVELLARDFLFHPERAFDRNRVSFMLFSLYLGIGIMALIGKWA